jgi:hypothetical protein
MTNYEENPINWDTVIKSHKRVVASDIKRAGTVIAQTEDDIVISNGVVNRHQFIMPKSPIHYAKVRSIYSVNFCYTRQLA